MATIGNTLPTLVDVLTRTAPNGSIANIVELLQKRNPVLQDIPWYEGNLATGHQFSARTALISPTYRKFNQGVAPVSSATDQYTEVCAMLESFSKVDCALAQLGGNAPAFRASEDNAFLQSYNIEISNGIFYNSTATSPEKFHGLSPRLAASAGNPASGQIIKADAAASGADQNSIWLVGWGEHAVKGIYPKGSTSAGFTTEDLGRQLTKDSNNNDFTAWVTHYMWQAGIAVEDYRYVVRAGNIDTSNLKADMSTGADLIGTMTQMVHTLFDTDSVQPRFYMNRTVAAMLDQQCLRRAGNDYLKYVSADELGMAGMGGLGTRLIPTWLGIPIRVTDALLSTESVIV